MGSKNVIEKATRFMYYTIKEILKSSNDDSMPGFFVNFLVQNRVKT
jgi:hypothetical protein